MLLLLLSVLSRVYIVVVVFCLIMDRCCCCCCGGCCCQGSMLLLLLSVLTVVVSVVVVVVICLIKDCCGGCCCWLLVLLLVYIYVLMCLFLISINKVRVTIIISQQHFICLSPYTWSHHKFFFFFKWPLCEVVSKLGGVKVFVNFCCDPNFLIMIFAPFIWLYIILLIFWFHRF